MIRYFYRLFKNGLEYQSIYEPQTGHKPPTFCRTSSVHTHISSLASMHWYKRKHLKFDHSSLTDLNTLLETPLCPLVTCFLCWQKPWDVLVSHPCNSAAYVNMELNPASCCSVLLETLMTAQLVMIFPTFYGNRTIDGHVHKSPPLEPEQLFQVHTFISYVLKEKVKGKVVPMLN
jgi:hypothetical protein